MSNYNKRIEDLCFWLNQSKFYKEADLLRVAISEAEERAESRDDPDDGWLIDQIQSGLNIAGIHPAAIGMGADILNAIIYTSRDMPLNAAISMLSATPVLGIAGNIASLSKEQAKRKLVEALSNSGMNAAAIRDIGNNAKSALKVGVDTAAKVGYSATSSKAKVQATSSHIDEIIEEAVNYSSREDSSDNSEQQSSCNIEGLWRPSPENRIRNYTKEDIRRLWTMLRSEGGVDRENLAYQLYRGLIRYSHFSQEDIRLSNKIMLSDGYRDWVSRFSPGDITSFNIENKKFWSNLNGINGVDSVGPNPSGHAQVDFKYEIDQRQPPRKRFQGIGLKEDLYFTFKISEEAKKNPDDSLKAIKNYLRWIYEVTKYAADTNAFLKENRYPGYIRGLKFNYGVHLKLLGGSIFDENDTLKIYFVNIRPDFLREFYNHVLGLKSKYSNFTINENRQRMARGFDLSDVPGRPRDDDKMSFGQILGYRMAFHLMNDNNISCIKNLNDNNDGKREFLNILGNIMKSSEYELITSMDTYTSGRGSGNLERVLRESKIL